MLMRQTHLEDADPVAAAPPVGRLQAVVAFHSALGEVELPNISKHDRGLLLHEKEGRKHRWNVLHFQFWRRTADERR